MTAKSNRRNFGTRVRDFAMFLGAVRECAAAVESGRRPRADAIKKAGLDPVLFDRRSL